MAFEQLYKFVDLLAEDYQSTIVRGNGSRQLQILNDLCHYYDTVCSNPKFKSQRDYCKEMITKLNPAFAKGYFKK